MVAELRRALEERAARIGYRAPTEIDKQLFCTCHVARAVESGSRYAADYTHKRECFYVEYVRAVATNAGRGGVYTRVEALPKLKSEK